MSASIFCVLCVLVLMAIWSFKRLIGIEKLSKKKELKDDTLYAENFGLTTEEDKYLVKSLELLARREWIHRHLVEDSPKVTTYMKLELKRLERERKHYVEGLKKRGIVDI